MQKICNSCGLERDEEKDFRWEYKSRGIRMMRCKYCQSELSKLHYQKNRQTYKNRTSIRKAQVLHENKLLIQAYLFTHPCVDCNKNDVRILDFDHISGQKKGEISDMLRQGYNWLTIQNEIAKCEIRCANCHRIKTAKNSKNWRNISLTALHDGIYLQMYNYLSTHPCTECEETDIRLLEFDHVQGYKASTISRLLTHRCNWSIIEAEIAKCEVRCANCHRIKTAERDGDWWKTICLSRDALPLSAQE